MGPSESPETEKEMTVIEGERLDAPEKKEEHNSIIRRNLIAFWFLGLCNHFPYIVMLSAAHDILTPHDSFRMNYTESGVTGGTNRSNMLVEQCNPISTGAVLLADVLPCLVIKLTAPWCMQSVPYHVRMSIVIVMSAIGLLVVSLSATIWLNLLGVSITSCGYGLGEITLLSLTSYFDKNTVSTLVSGMGGAHLFGALSYAGLTALGLTPGQAILLMLVIPVIMAISYFAVLVRPNHIENRSVRYTKRSEIINPVDSTKDAQSENSPDEKKTTNNFEMEREQKYLLASDTQMSSLTVKEKFALVQPLLKYMIPLAIVYFAEYFINQALTELIYFDNTIIPSVQQYRWYQVLYQIGVFVSRSSVNVIEISKIWVFSILQILNIFILLFQIFLQFIPIIWIVFAIILYEGLLGGAAFVNSFYSITKEIDDVEIREFSMGLTSLADTVGIAVAGAVAMPVHNYICTL